MSLNNNKEIIKDNKKRLKEYKKQLRSEKFDLENELEINDKGEAVINCNISKSENLFSSFDIAQDRTIKNEFNDFLLEEADIIPISYNLELKMHVDENFSDENKNKITKAIKRFYSFKITSDKIKARKHFFTVCMFYLLGLIALFASPFIAKINTIFPLYESCIILSWFFLWEATGITILNGSKMKIHIYNMLRLYYAKVTFVTKSKNNI